MPDDLYPSQLLLIMTNRLISYALENMQFSATKIVMNGPNVLSYVREREE